MTADKYPGIIRLFHWSMAILVLMQFALGFLMEDLPKQSVFIHAGLGFLILALTVVRLALNLRLKRIFPPKPDGFSDKEWKITKIGHGWIYALLIAVPVTGALGFFTGEHDLEEIHETLVWIFILLLAGHIAITIKHQIFDKKKIIQRMT